MSTIVRGSNPIWSLVDLDGNQLDDTYYLFVLQPTIPYLPANIYQDSTGTARANPVQFLGNGTLPVNLYFDSDTTYRLEIRQGNTSSDPLIYLIDNYNPNGGGSGGGDTPITSVSLNTDNQLSNPQFAVINFPETYTISATDPDDFEFAPGWFVHLEGTGTLTLTRQTYSESQSNNETNASYAMKFDVASWDVSYIYQRFDQNGVLWAGKNVSASLMAKVGAGNFELNTQLYDSIGTLLGEPLENITINTSYDEYRGVVTLPDSVNTGTPPSAYIEYRVNLPSGVNQEFDVTSLQLVAGDLEDAANYEQTTIERQTDQLFHYYYDSIQLQPKENFLTGYNFSLNPFQFLSSTITAQATNKYVADQLICIQQNIVASATGNNVQTGRAALADNYGFTVKANTSSNQFALIEYIDEQTIRGLWNNKASLFVKLKAVKQNSGANLRMKARLIYRASACPTIAANEPILTWSAGSDPVFTANWTAISPAIDAVYNLDNGENTITFDNFQLPASTNAAMTLGVVIYTIDNMTETGTPDEIIFKEGALVANELAAPPSVITADQMIQKCQYYYEKSYGIGVLPGTSTFTSAQIVTHGWWYNGSGYFASLNPFHIPFKTNKRKSPVTVIYSPTIATSDRYNSYYKNGASARVAIGSPATFTSDYNTITQGTYSVGFEPKKSAYLTTFSGSANPYSFFSIYHFTADARQGV